MAWDNPSPPVSSATAYSFGNGASGTSGLLSSANSVVGTVVNGTNTFSFDATRNRLFVGRANSSIVSIIFIDPTAAGVSVGGQVTVGKNGLARARVTLTDFNGATRSMQTSSFGYYRFDDLEAGATYIVSVNHKRYFFEPQVVSAIEDLTELNFMAEQ